MQLFVRTCSTPIDPGIKGDSEYACACTCKGDSHCLFLFWRPWVRPSVNKQNPSKHDSQIYIQNNISTATKLRKSVIFQVSELLQTEIKCWNGGSFAWRWTSRLTRKASTNWKIRSLGLKLVAVVKKPVLVGLNPTLRRKHQSTMKENYTELKDPTLPTFEQHFLRISHWSKLPDNWCSEVLGFLQYADPKFKVRHRFREHQEDLPETVSPSPSVRHWI